MRFRTPRGRVTVVGSAEDSEPNGGTMNRILPTLLFIVVVVSWVAIESGGGSPYSRTGMVALIGMLAVWKIVDFWRRHKDEPDSSGASAPSADKTL